MQNIDLFLSKHFCNLYKKKSNYNYTFVISRFVIVESYFSYTASSCRNSYHMIFNMYLHKK